METIRPVAIKGEITWHRLNHVAGSNWKRKKGNEGRGGKEETQKREEGEKKKRRRGKRGKEETQKREEQEMKEEEGTKQRENKTRTES